MNNLQNEYLAEYHRQELLKEREQIRLLESALKARPHQPSLFTRVMHGFANWMIATGSELHERYEIPTVHSHKVHSNSFAH